MLLFAILMIRDHKFLGLLIRAEKSKKDRFFLWKIGKSDKTIGKSDKKTRKIIIIFKNLISKSAKFLPFKKVRNGKPASLRRSQRLS